MSECPYCQNTFEMTDTCSDEFRMWQGLQGPYYIPSVDDEGVISWTNTGGLPNPDPVDISGPPGKGLTIKGVVATVGDLPEDPEDGDTYLVGASDPYDGYIWLNGTWVELGDISKGETGEGVPTGGTTGQVLAKASSADYDTEWVNQSAGVDPATATPNMDGTAAVGSSAKYAREDHVHPTDTSRASASDVSELSKDLGTFVRPNLLDNWYFVGGGSQQGGGQLPINQRGQTVYTGNKVYSVDRWYLYEAADTVTLQSNGLKVTRSSGSWYTITQPLENPSQYIGKTLTLSVLYEGTSTSDVRARVIDGSTTVFGTNGSKTGGLLVGTGTISSFTTGLAVSFYGTVNATTDIIVKAIKLEIGDTQTLAHQENGVWVLNEIPNYRDEFRKCQYYYQIIGRYNNWKFYDAVIRESGSSGKVCLMAIPIVPMRTTPSVSLSSTELQMVDYPGGPGSGLLTVSSVFEVGYSKGDGLINIQLNATNSLTAGDKGYVFIGSSGSGYIMLSADL